MNELKYDVLKKFFGYEQFRDGQEQLIDSVLNGEDVLGIMPTGAGKSLCFQVPALVFSGITLVVSPLISLMKDQVSALVQAGVRAAYINSSLTERQVRLALQNARNGVYKIIYIAPERLETYDFLNFACNAEISMLTIDEAHCISHWGQDFRPSYIKIIEFIEKLPKRPIVSAFTATATPRVREDIIDLLKLKSPKILVTSFDRKNLYFEVQQPKDKFLTLTRYLSSNNEKSGVVYCSTRNTVEEVCEKLISSGFNATRYHAGLSDKERHDNQDDFLFDKAQIMVATNAFGMGIDKSNVSFVVHYNMPKSIESYYQEAGRAGRDGENAECILLYNAQDLRTNLWLIENSKDIEYPDIETEKMLKERDRQRLKEMNLYCNITECLRGYILNYFGEDYNVNCENCSSCNSSFEVVDVTDEAKKILSCVYRVRERYGIKMIIDVLRGSKNSRIYALELNKLPTFGVSNLSENMLKSIISHLVLNDYIFTTNDEYPIVKLGSRANDILRNNATVHMKVAKATEIEIRHAKELDAKKPIDRRLFDKLKELRLDIANEQKVPAFVVFADSTLTDLCIKKPSSDNELLQVSGIGQVKLEKFGGRILKTIKQFFSTHKEQQLTGGNNFSDELYFNGVVVSDEEVTISVIADRLNCIQLQHGQKKVTAAKLNDWLVSIGMLCVVKKHGQAFKISTEDGQLSGITTKEKEVGEETYFVNYYSRQAQEMIIRRLVKTE